MDSELILIEGVIQYVQLPAWYQPEEAISTGYIALRKARNDWRRKRENLQCSKTTFIRNAIRYAILKELRYLRRYQNRKVGVIEEEGGKITWLLLKK